MTRVPGILLLFCRTDPEGAELVTSAVTFDPTRHCSAPGQRLPYQQTVLSSRHPKANK